MPVRLALGKSRANSRRLVRTCSGDLGTKAAQHVCAEALEAPPTGSVKSHVGGGDYDVFKPKDSREGHEFGVGTCFVLWDSRPLQSFQVRSVAKVRSYDDGTGEVLATLWRPNEYYFSQDKFWKTTRVEVSFTLGQSGKMLEEFAHFDGEPCIVDHILQIEPVPSPMSIPTNALSRCKNGHELTPTFVEPGWKAIDDYHKGIVTSVAGDPRYVQQLCF